MSAQVEAVQLDLEFSSMLLPGRTSLRVGEVAQLLRVTEQHVFDLIDEGKLNAVDVGGGIRRHWRVPVSGYEKFLRERSSATAACGEVPLVKNSQCS